MKDEPILAEGGPGIPGYRAHIGIEPEPQRIEPLGAILDLAERDGAGLYREAGMIEVDSIPRALRLRRVAALEIQIARHAEERGQRAEIERGEVHEIEDQAICFSGKQPG